MSHRHGNAALGEMLSNICLDIGISPRGVRRLLSAGEPESAVRILMDDALRKRGVAIVRLSVFDADGSLRSRRLPGAILEDPADIAAQAIRLAREGVRVETSGEPRYWMVETLCLHGDHPRAVENARVVRAALKQAGVLIQPLS